MIGTFVGHDREFIWKERGFASVTEMNEAIIERHNEILTPEDTIYVLGDLMLGGQNLDGIEMIKAIKGNKIIIAGNHDTDRRKQAYFKELNIPVWDACRINYAGYHFYLSHYPTITSNLEKESLKQCTLNLFGHTHQKNNFFYDMPFMYHVGVDSHDCYPVSVDQIIEDMRAKVKECENLC